VFRYKTTKTLDSAINYRKTHNKRNMFENKYATIISNYYCILLILFLSLLIRKCVLYCDLEKNQEKRQTRARLLLTKEKQKTTREKRERQKSKQKEQKQTQEQTQEQTQKRQQQQQTKSDCRNRINDLLARTLVLFSKQR